ncbi:MAG: cytochrome c oxidase subunit 3 [Methanobacteriota archaeon]
MHQSSAHPPSSAHSPVHAPDEYTLPHGSVWPFRVAITIFLVYLGLMWFPFMVLAVLSLAYNVRGIVREDMVWWRQLIGTGPRNGWYGVIFFLCTEVMLFGALFATWFNGRANADVWPPRDVPELPIVFTGINTLILLASGATMHWAHAAIRNGDRTNFNRGLVLTLILGGVFLAFQVKEYSELIHHGMTLSSGMYGATFYALTGTHGIHVLGGLLLILIVWLRSLGGQFTKERHLGVEVTAIYWHFVDVVWVILYAVVYLQVV